MALRLEAATGLAGGSALQGIPSRARLDLRQFGGAAEVALRVGRFPQALGEPRELEVRAAAFLERQARLEKAAPLAPEPCLRAEAADRRGQAPVPVAPGGP